MLRAEARRLATAVQFLTRLPVRGSGAAGDLEAACRYFPLVGLLVGGLIAGWYLLALQLWSHDMACALALALGVLLTGAFHEDGFADSCDGFGGGWQREDVLRIMKDSRLGTYGGLGLVLLLGGKWLALVAIAPAQVPLALLLAHSGGRALAVACMRGLDYCRMDASSKVRPVATAIRRRDLLISLLWPLLLLPWLPWQQSLAAGLLLLLLRWSCQRWFRARLGGYTGDCLGAAEQLGELG
ncbi:MAG: adenosylcobinamide-GDP ribazoletransferase, partial [Planctomycetota bacterium]